MNTRPRFPKGTWMRLKSPDDLRSVMGMRGFSCERTARYAGCSKSFIVHLRTGHKTSCTPALAQDIAEALGVPLDLLFVAKVSQGVEPPVPRRRIAGQVTASRKQTAA